MVVGRYCCICSICCNSCSGSNGSGGTVGSISRRYNKLSNNLIVGVITTVIAARAVAFDVVGGSVVLVLSLVAHNY